MTEAENDLLKWAYRELYGFTPESEEKLRAAYPPEKEPVCPFCGRKLNDKDRYGEYVKVVRCKECKFNYGLANSCEFNPQDIVCTYWATDGLDSNDFCSQAKRKDEVEHDRKG